MKRQAEGGSALNYIPRTFVTQYANYLRVTYESHVLIVPEKLFLDFLSFIMQLPRKIRPVRAVEFPYIEYLAISATGRIAWMSCLKNTPTRYYVRT